MEALRTTLKSKTPLAAFVAVATASLLTVTGLPVSAQDSFVGLSSPAGGGAPGASGEATIRLVGRVAVGEVHVNNLPPQPFGSGRFYGVWFVNGENKAFLGALIAEESIIFSQGGNGEMKFRATQFTAGPDAGSPITFGAAGTNVIIVLIENIINGLTPSPVGPVPGSGVAVVGTF